MRAARLHHAIHLIPRKDESQPHEFPSPELPSSECICVGRRTYQVLHGLCITLHDILHLEPNSYGDNSVFIRVITIVFPLCTSTFTSSSGFKCASYSEAMNTRNLLLNSALTLIQLPNFKENLPLFPSQAGSPVYSTRKMKKRILSIRETLRFCHPCHRQPTRQQESEVYNLEIKANFATGG